MDFALDGKGDLLITPKGDLALTNSVAQKIKIAVRWFANEWRWDRDKGCPYLTYLFVKNPDTDYVESLIREAIFSVEEVTEVGDVTVSYDAKTRQGTIRYTAYTDQETIKEEVTLYG